MKIFSNYDEIPSHFGPIVLTIGNFDAVHLGHRSLLGKAKEVAKAIGGNLVVLTFSNHPVEVLRPETTISKICSKEQKLRLLEQEAVDGVILFEFTKAFSRQTAEQFLSSLQKHFSFHTLVLGHDAHLGSDRRGDSPFMYEVARKHHFAIQYVPAYSLGGAGEPVISSSLIRHAIQRGDFPLAEKMLGRKYSICSHAKTVDPSTIALTGLKSLCLPPVGSYPVNVHLNGAEVPGIAVIAKRSNAVSVDLQFSTPLIFNDALFEVFFL
jgi:riboflavin kinase / FMN adenylyltransferase